MTEKEQEVLLKEKLLLFSKYQSKLTTIKNSVDIELDFLRTDLIESLDQVLESIDKKKYL